MELNYRIYIVFNDEKEVQRHYETKDDAIMAMMQLLANPMVHSAVLAHYSNEYPAGYNVMCSIRKKSNLRGRKP